eukprot:scaffold36607_cov72-Phaeocystis_antarctica.AAC.3
MNCSDMLGDGPMVALGLVGTRKTCRLRGKTTFSRRSERIDSSKKNASAAVRGSNVVTLWVLGANRKVGSEVVRQKLKQRLRDSRPRKGTQHTRCNALLDRATL